MVGRQLLILTLIVVTCCGCTDARGDGEPASQAAGVTGTAAARANPTAKSRKLALLVGINKYKAINGLSGCVADVRNMEDLLRGTFEFSDDSIRILTDEQATHDAIVQAFKDHLIARADKDTVVVFHYCGHGSLMKDPSGKSSSGLMSTIVPHDSRTQGVFDISADELRGLFSLLAKKTRNVTFIFDSCHSGLVLKDIATARARVVEPDTRVPPPLPPEAALAARGAGEPDDGFKSRDYALLSACQADEVAFEYADEKGNPCGALTHFFVAEVKGSGKAGATYRDVMDKVKAKVTGQYQRQHPQLEGAKIDDFVLSDNSKLAQPFVLASPEGDGVALEAGQVHGMTEGSVFDIYAPGTKEFDDPAKAVARAELTFVNAYRSKARLIGNRPVEAASRAVERVHDFRDRKIRLHIVKSDRSPILRTVRQAVAGGNRTDADNTNSPRFNQIFELVEDSADARLVLAEQNERGKPVIVLSGGDATRLSAPVPVDEEMASDHVLRQLTSWAKWLNVLALENPRGNLDVSFEIHPAPGSNPAPSLAKRPELTLVAGQEVEFSVTNHSGRNVYFAILDLASDGSVGLVYPGEGRNEVLVSRGTYTDRAPTSVPEGRDSARDNLKLVVTQAPVDFQFLRQVAPKDPARGEAPPRAVDDPLVELLGQAALMERSLRKTKLDGWATKIQVLEVVTKP